MIIKVADTAGFCFGVNRAVKMVDELLNSGKKVCTLGPIIHNQQVIDEFAKRGVYIVDSPDEVKPDTTLVIRSHGVSVEFMDQLKELKVDYIDATCPFVSKIHRIVNKASKEGKIILIAGDENHPEVKGIRGNCFGESFVFESRKKLEELVHNEQKIKGKPVILVSQTTFSTKEWENCLKTLKKHCTNANIFDTICNATSNRQKEADNLSRISDLMIVIGDKSSSNTSKLRDICSENCETFFIQTAKDLPIEVLAKKDLIGVTAGASTPASIIKEVQEKMSDSLNKDQIIENEENFNFEEMLEESLKNFNTDEKVHGVVVSITPNEVYVDVGRKQAGFIPLSELTSDPNAKVEDLVKVGDEMDLLIMRTNDQEGTIMLSKRRLDALKGWDEIIKAHEKDEILTGTVVSIVKGGIIVLSDGARVFVPASQTGVIKKEALDEMVKKEVRFKIIEVNKGRRKAVGSIRSVLKEEKKKLLEEFWENAEVGKKYTGKVRSITNYGVFVDLGGVDGMIHISELSWDRIKHPSDVVNIGDSLDVYIKELDKEKGKIALGYKKEEDNPWELLKKDYPVGTVLKTEVVGMTPFGAFARILPRIDGLIHISQISDERIEKPQDVLSVGDKVKVIITNIDFDKKRVSLSIKALNDKKVEDDAVAETDESTEKSSDGEKEISTEDVKSEQKEKSPKSEKKKSAKTKKKNEETKAKATKKKADSKDK